MQLSMALGSSASGQALGYLFQFERALYWLSAPEIDYVSIETDDDVVAQLKSGQAIENIYEQDKNISGTANPFSNSNINLWKTLAIWLELKKNRNTSKTRFVLATNKRINKNCTIYKLHQANFISNYKLSIENLTEFYDDLFASGINSKGKVKEYYNLITSKYSKTEIVDLLSKVVLSVGDYANNKVDFRDSIKQNLRIGSDVPFNAIYDKLLGYIISKVIEQWTAGQDSILYSSHLLNLKDLFVKETLERPFLESAISALPVLENERFENKEKDFIKQLSLLDLDDNEYIEAIDDYLRATKERDRWAENNSIPTQEDIRLFDKELEKNWKRTFDKHLINRKTQPELTDGDVGSLIYINTLDCKGFTLSGYPVLQSYTTCGGFHILSNKFTIGWHPNWKSHFKLI